MSMGMCEIQMLPKLNPELRQFNTLKIPKLGRNWKEYVSKRDRIWDQYEFLLEQEAETAARLDDSEAEYSSDEEGDEEECEGDD